MDSTEQGGTRGFLCLSFVVVWGWSFTIKVLRHFSISVWVGDSCYSVSSALVTTKHCLVLFAVHKMKVLSEAIKCSRVTWTAVSCLSVQIQSSTAGKSTQNHWQAEFRAHEWIFVFCLSCWLQNKFSLSVWRFDAAHQSHALAVQWIMRSKRMK